jgi:hypothetical protein
VAEIKLNVSYKEGTQKEKFLAQNICIYCTGIEPGRFM